MNLLLTNPWLFLAVTIWVVCGIVAIIQKKADALTIAGQASICLGIFYMIAKHV